MNSNSPSPPDAEMSKASTPSEIKAHNVPERDNLYIFHYRFYKGHLISQPQTTQTLAYHNRDTAQEKMEKWISQALEKHDDWVKHEWTDEDDGVTYVSLWNPNKSIIHGGDYWIKVEKVEDPCMSQRVRDRVVDEVEVEVGVGVESVAET